MYGWGTGLAVNLSDSFAVKADISGAYRTVENTDISAKNHNILGGVQYTKRYEAFSVFGEALGGLAMIGFGGAGDYSMKGFGLSFGGGVDWFFSERFGWRNQFNYMPSFLKDTESDKLRQNAFRYQTGIVIRLGER